MNGELESDKMKLHNSWTTLNEMNITFDPPFRFFDPSTNHLATRICKHFLEPNFRNQSKKNKTLLFWNVII